MRIFKTSPFGDIVDLDDSATYSTYPTDTRVLREMMFSKIGYFFCYTKFWHKDIFEDEYGQVARVNNLITYFTENERENYDNVMWYQERIFLLEDEIENMC